MNTGNLNNESLSARIPREGDVPFSELYIALRKQEQRIYSDTEVLHLPIVSGNHPHVKEWNIRMNSCARLVNYLKRKGPIKILEVGCGNGWLSHQLSKLTSSMVTGMDVNQPELSQAQRVFSNKRNLSFIYGDLYELKPGLGDYNVIVFAASIQYFEALATTVNIALKQLRTGGELHIIDSPFYSEHSIRDARQRTKEYFSKTGFPAMEKHYFHHSIASLHEFNYAVLYNPHSFINKLSRNRNPFHWMRIQKEI